MANTATKTKRSGIHLGVDDLDQDIKKEINGVGKRIGLKPQQVIGILLSEHAGTVATDIASLLSKRLVVGPTEPTAPAAVPTLSSEGLV